MLDSKMRELHKMYYILGQEDAQCLRAVNYEEFVTFFRALDETGQACFVANLRRRYSEYVEKQVSAGLEVVEKYLEPE